jgi:hypothetical protein
MTENANCASLVSFVLATMIAAGLVLPIPRAGATESPPHNLTKPDGTLDSEACSICHTPSMDLERSKLETCTLCHAETVHSGSEEHLRADPAKVAEKVSGRPKTADLPLTTTGASGADVSPLSRPRCSRSLARPRLDPTDQGLPAAVREGVIDRWARLPRCPIGRAAREFATTGTRQLRDRCRTAASAGGIAGPMAGRHGSPARLLPRRWPASVLGCGGHAPQFGARRSQRIRRWAVRLLPQHLADAMFIPGGAAGFNLKFNPATTTWSQDSRSAAARSRCGTAQADHPPDRASRPRNARSPHRAANLVLIGHL